MEEIARREQTKAQIINKLCTYLESSASIERCQRPAQLAQTVSRARPPCQTPDPSLSCAPRAQTLWCAAAGRISSCCSRREESRDTHHSMETQAGRDREGAAIVVYIAGGGRLGGMSSEFSRGKLCASPLHTHARAPSLLPS